MLDTLIGMPLMLAEILAAECIFTVSLKKRAMYCLRLIASSLNCLFVMWSMLVVYFVVTGDFYTYNGNGDGSFGMTAFKFSLYLFIFATTIFAMIFCCDDTVWRTMYYCAGAYVTQHMAKNIASFILIFIKHKPDYLEYVVDIAVCAALYAAVYFVLIKDKEPIENQSAIKKKIFFTFISIFVCIGMSRVCIDDVMRGETATIAETLYAVLSCIFILYIYSSYTKEDFIHREVLMIKELNRRDAEHYKLYKDNVDLINMKYHDLKHQLDAIRSGSGSSGTEEFLQSVETYGCIADTGNRALDIVFTEKSLFCRENDIRLTCNVHGADFESFDDSDIFSLFGNALSNAIECVSQITDPEKRSIDVNSLRKGNILSLHFENYIDEIPLMKDGMPVTKKDKKYHGFGMKSIKYIVEKYGGEMVCEVVDNRFVLNMIFKI